MLHMHITIAEDVYIQDDYMRLWPKYKKNKTMTLSSNEFPSFISQSF